MHWGYSPIQLNAMPATNTKIDLDIEYLPEGKFEVISASVEGLDSRCNSIAEVIAQALAAAAAEEQDSWFVQLISIGYFNIAFNSL